MEEKTEQKDLNESSFVITGQIFGHESISLFFLISCSLKCQSSRFLLSIPGSVLTAQTARLLNSSLTLLICHLYQAGGGRRGEVCGEG